jgi:D-alanyl-D-alanine carboxypeptidase
MRRGIASLALLLITALSPPTATAGPALLFEVSNGKVLFAEDVDNDWHPASLTKLMTAYLVFQEIKSGRLSLTSKIACSAAANKEPPSKIGIAVGGELTVDKALQALIIKSANDVAVMLAEAVAGNEPAFVERMNATAKRLGMTRTTFVNANGLPADEQVTTARDLAKLSRAVLTDFPEYAHYWSMPHMRFGKNRLNSHNQLLRSVDGADGLKTGFTCDSGFNIVASATRDGRQLVAVVLGDSTSAERNVRAASLLEYGFQQQAWGQLLNKKTLDNMPFAPTAEGVTSVRANVESWSCNPKKHARAKRHRRRHNAAPREASQATKADASQKLQDAQASATTGSAFGMKGPITPGAQAQQ